MTPLFSKIQRVPAYRKLANAILEQILDGRLKEGAPLPTETLLSEMFGVNRATVREGIRVLEEANMIRRENNSKKMYISRPSHEETGAHVERALLMQDISFGELWEAVVAIEPTLARLAAEKHDKALLDRMDENIEKTKLAIKNKQSLLPLDQEFHILIETMSANRVLHLSRGAINSLFLPSYRKVMTKGPVSTKRFLEAHQAIANAIRSRNADEAESLMRKHVQDLFQWMKLAGINLDKLMPKVVRLI